MSSEHLLTTTLIPVEPRPEFVRELKVELIERAQTILKPLPQRPFTSRWWWVVAGIGGLLSVIGMAALGIRRARAMREMAPQPQPAQ